MKTFEHPHALYLEKIKEAVGIRTTFVTLPGSLIATNLFRTQVLRIDKSPPGECRLDSPNGILFGSRLLTGWAPSVRSYRLV